MDLVFLWEVFLGVNACIFIALLLQRQFCSSVSSLHFASERFCAIYCEGISKFAVSVAFAVRLTMLVYARVCSLSLSVAICNLHKIYTWGDIPNRGFCLAPTFVCIPLYTVTNTSALTNFTCSTIKHITTNFNDSITMNKVYRAKTAHTMLKTTLSITLKTTRVLSLRGERRGHWLFRCNKPPVSLRLDWGDELNPSLWGGALRIRIKTDENKK